MAQFRRKAKSPAPLYPYSVEKLSSQQREAHKAHLEDLQAHWNGKLARKGLSVDAGKPPRCKRAWRAWKLIQKASRGK